MAIGSLGITKMATKGGIITLCITVPLTVFECYLKDERAWYQLAGYIGADLVKVGIGSVMGAIAGLVVAGGTAFVAGAPIAAAIIVGITVGFALEMVDNRFQLTDKLIKLLEELPAKGEKAAVAAGEGFWSFMRLNGFGMGSWVNP